MPRRRKLGIYCFGSKVSWSIKRNPSKLPDLKLCGIPCSTAQWGYRPALPCGSILKMDPTWFWLLFWSSNLQLLYINSCRREERQRSLPRKGGWTFSVIYRQITDREQTWSTCKTSKVNCNKLLEKQKIAHVVLIAEEKLSDLIRISFLFAVRP